MAIFYILFLLFLFTFASLIVIYTLSYGISPAPSSHKAQIAILKQIPRETTGVIYDLGSGWGNLAIALARHCPQAQVKGYEISPIPYFVSVVFRKILNIRNVQFARKDFTKLSLNDAALVTCYLYPGIMHHLGIQLAEQLPRGSVVITHTFSLPLWTPEYIVNVNDIYNTKVYVYKKR
jgi:hypothetical protein